MISKDSSKIKRQTQQNTGFLIRIIIKLHSYRKLTKDGLVSTPSSKIKVGDIIEINADQRVPADLLLLYARQKISSFILKLL